MTNKINNIVDKETMDQLSKFNYALKVANREGEKLTEILSGLKDVMDKVDENQSDIDVEQ